MLHAACKLGSIVLVPSSAKGELARHDDVSLDEAPRSSSSSSSGSSSSSSSSSSKTTECKRTKNEQGLRQRRAAFLAELHLQRE